MKIKYIGPHDEVEIAATGVVVKHDEVLDLLPDPEQVDIDEGVLAATAQLAAGLLQQPRNFEPADDEAVALLDAIRANDAGAEPDIVETQGDGLHDLTNAQLTAIADNEGVDLAGATKKADLIEAIRNHRDNHDENGA